MTKQASEIMKLNFMTDQGSKRETMRWAWRAVAPPPFCPFFPFRVRLGPGCGRETGADAPCQADGRSTRVVSASDGADAADGLDAPGPDETGVRSCSSVRGAFTWAGYGEKSRWAAAGP